MVGVELVLGFCVVFGASASADVWRELPPWFERESTRGGTVVGAQLARYQEV